MGSQIAIDPGTRFGRLVVLSEADRQFKCGRMGRHFSLMCDCGGKKVISLRDLRSGTSSSCGCIKRERATRLGYSRRVHGDSTERTSEYNSWRSMKERCLNPNKANFARYGGRGIKICSKWINNFPAFLRDMGRKPSPQHTLDRVDTLGDYEPNNCRWATPKEQANNRRNSRHMEA